MSCDFRLRLVLGVADDDFRVGYHDGEQVEPDEGLSVFTNVVRQGC